MKTIYLFLTFFLGILTGYSQVAINSDGSDPDASAMLDVSSDSKGILIPRLSTQDRDNNISNPAEGLVIYNTEKDIFEYYDGNEWRGLETTGKAWLLTGNAGTDGSQFLGTTDAQPLIFKTDNTERMRIKENGVIGINVTPNDSYLLYASGNTYHTVGRFVNTLTSSDGIGVYGETAARDYYGYGGYFKGGFMGVGAEVIPTQNYYYFGVKGKVSGGNGHNYGFYSETNGNGTNYGLYSYVLNGQKAFGILSVVGNADYNYAFYSTSNIEDGKGAVAYLANSNDTGTGILVLGSNVSSYYRMTNRGAAISATGTKYAITAHSKEDDDGAIMVLGQYQGNTQTNATGVMGLSKPADNYGYGVKGVGGKIGVFGQADNGVAGVYGYAVDTTLYGVFSNGNLGVTGSKSFVIDHPLDPADKYLKHFSIESNEVLNVYRGNVVLDNNGKAEVQLPAYFHAINRNFSYLLTPVGAPAPGLYVEKEIDMQGRFTIAGGRPGQKVSWYVYAERNDPYLQYYPESRRVEVNKGPKEKGKYLRPELYGQPKDKGLFYQPIKINVTEIKAEKDVLPPPSKEKPVKKE